MQFSSSPVSNGYPPIAHTDVRRVTESFARMDIVPPPPGFGLPMQFNYVQRIRFAPNSSALQALWAECFNTLTLEQLKEFLLTISRFEKKHISFSFTSLVMRQVANYITAFDLSFLARICKASVHITLLNDGLKESAEDLFLHALEALWNSPHFCTLPPAKLSWILDALQFFAIVDSRYYDVIQKALEPNLDQCSTKQLVVITFAYAKLRMNTRGFLETLQRKLLQREDLHEVNLFLLTRLCYEISFHSENVIALQERVLGWLLNQIQRCGSLEIRTISACLSRLAKPREEMVEAVCEELMRNNQSKLREARVSTLSEVATIASLFDRTRKKYLTEIKEALKAQPVELLSSSSFNLAKLIVSYLRENDTHFLHQLYFAFLQENPTWKPHLEFDRSQISHIKTLRALQLVALAMRLAKQPRLSIVDIELLKALYVELFSRASLWQKGLNRFNPLGRLNTPQDRQQFDMSNILQNPLSPPVTHILKQIYLTKIANCKAVETHFGRPLRKKIRALS